MTFRFHWADLVCPFCRGDLCEAVAGEESNLTCRGCGRTFPVICGIPDLRVLPDPYISFEGDRTKARMLYSRFGDLDFAGIIALYYHITPETPAHDVRANTARLLNGVAKAESTLEGWSASFGEVRGQSLLDVGCGTAPLLAASQPRFARAIGIDVGLRWLVVAKRRLLELGLDIPLVAACGEALPFRDGTFDAVSMDSFLEICRDGDAALREACRVLRPSGSLLVSTPNKFSIGPDPHIGVPGGGFLPQFIVDTLAKQRMARPPIRHFFTARSLGRAMRRAGFAAARVELPSVSDAQQAVLGRTGQRAARWYNALRRTPIARQALFAVGPILHGMGTKS